MKLKICGIRDNLHEVGSLNPDYLGFIFWEPSARYISGVPSDFPEGPKRVGVFVDATISIIMERVRTFGLSLIQLHGNESPEFCTALKKEIRNAKEENISTVKIIKAFPVHDDFDFSVLGPYEDVCDYFLFDTKGKLPGGNGYAFNWHLLEKYPSRKPFLLSGGIGLDETPQLIRFMESPQAAYCHAVDVNSRFEIKPGLKDIPELRRFKKLIFDT